MLQRAHDRVAAAGWQNVTLIEGAVREADVPHGLDGALLVLTHDIMRSPGALRRIIGALRPGGRIAAGGSKRPPRWLWPLRVYVELKARRYVTTFEGFDRPWTLLAGLVPGLKVKSILLGAAYIVSGTKPS